MAREYRLRAAELAMLSADSVKAAATADMEESCDIHPGRFDAAQHRRLAAEAVAKVATSITLGRNGRLDESELVQAVWNAAELRHGVDEITYAIKAIRPNADVRLAQCLSDPRLRISSDLLQVSQRFGPAIELLEESLNQTSVSSPEALYRHTLRTLDGVLA